VKSDVQLNYPQSELEHIYGLNYCVHLSVPSYLNDYEPLTSHYIVHHSQHVGLSKPRRKVVPLLLRVEGSSNPFKSIIVAKATECKKLVL